MCQVQEAPIPERPQTSTCTAKLRNCRSCKEDTHHVLLCPKINTQSNCTIKVTLVGKVGLLTILVQTTWVMLLQGMKLGTYWDLGSSDNYITKKMAKKLGLKGVDVEIQTEGKNYSPGEDETLQLADPR